MYGQKNEAGVLAREDAGKYLTVAPSRKMGVVKFPDYCLNVKTSIMNVYRIIYHSKLKR